MDVLVLSVFILGTLAALFVFIYTKNEYRNPMLDVKIDPAETIKSSEQIIPVDYNLGKLVINLPSRSGRLRFLAINTHLILYEKKMLPSVEKKKERILDTIINETGKLMPGELNSISGKIILEHRLKKNLNTLFQKKLIKDIHFSQFVVQ